MATGKGQVYFVNLFINKNRERVIEMVNIDYVYENMDKEYYINYEEVRNYVLDNFGNEEFIDSLIEEIDFQIDTIPDKKSISEILTGEEVHSFMNMLKWCLGQKNNNKKRIEADAFMNYYNLESVTIPSTIEYIEEAAFLDSNTTVYLPYHTPDQLNSRDFKYENNEIFSAKKAVYGTGDNQTIIEDKKITEQETQSISTNSNTKNESAKSVKLKVGEKVATVNELSVALDTPAYINNSNNSVYVPLRFVSVALVGEDNMMWDSNTKTVAIFKDNKSIKFTVGNNNMIVDGKSINMGNSIVPEIKDGRVFVPFRSLGEALGMNVKWDSNTKTAIYE